MISELRLPYEQLGLTEHDAWQKKPRSGGPSDGDPVTMQIEFAVPDGSWSQQWGDGSYIVRRPCHFVATWPRRTTSPSSSSYSSGAGYAPCAIPFVTGTSHQLHVNADKNAVDGAFTSPDFAQSHGRAVPQPRPLPRGRRCRPARRETIDVHDGRTP